MEEGASNHNVPQAGSTCAAMPPRSLHIAQSDCEVRRPAAPGGLPTQASTSLTILASSWSAWPRIICKASLTSEANLRAPGSPAASSPEFNSNKLIGMSGITQSDRSRARQRMTTIGSTAAVSAVSARGRLFVFGNPLGSTGVRSPPCKKQGEGGPLASAGNRCDEMAVGCAVANQAVSAHSRRCAGCTLPSLSGDT